MRQATTGHCCALDVLRVVGVVVSMAPVVASTIISPTTSTSTYVAAVAEHAASFPTTKAVVTRDKALKYVSENIAAYAGHAMHAHSLGAQIIVFPEDGLYGFLNCKRDQMRPYLEEIPEPGDSQQGKDTSASNVNPCTDPSYASPEHEILHNISCIAKVAKLVVVADMGEVVPCNAGVDPGCPPDGRFQYNTQVAVDENGVLIGKYRKHHLFFEPQFNVPNTSFVSTFTTSFGVTYGMMVCYDIMFKDPSSALSSAGISDVVFSDWWVNTPPTFAANPFFNAWSRHYKVNLLGAGGVMKDAWQFSGTGLFSSGRVVQQFYNNGTQTEDQLLVGAMPISNTSTSATVAKSADTKTNTNSRDGTNDQEIPRPELTKAAALNSNQTVGKDIHCENTEDLIRRRRTRPPIPSGTNQSVKIAPVGEWGFYLFDAIEEGFGTFSAVSGPLTCTVEYKLGRAPLMGEAFGVLAYAGEYDNSYYEEFCALSVCESLMSCKGPMTQSEKQSHWTHVKVSATSTTKGLSTFGLAIADGGAAFEDPEQLDIDEETRQVSTGAAWPKEGQPLISMSVFSQILK